TVHSPTSAGRGPSGPSRAGMSRFPRAALVLRRDRHAGARRVVIDRREGFLGGVASSGDALGDRSPCDRSNGRSRGGLVWRTGGTLQLWTERARQGGRGKPLGVGFRTAMKTHSIGDSRPAAGRRPPVTRGADGTRGGEGVERRERAFPGGEGGGGAGPPVLSLAGQWEGDGDRVRCRPIPPALGTSDGTRGSCEVCHRVPLNREEPILTAKAAVVATAKRVRMRCAALLRSRTFSFDVAVPGVERSAADRRFEGKLQSSKRGSREATFRPIPVTEGRSAARTTRGVAGQPCPGSEMHVSRRATWSNFGDSSSLRVGPGVDPSLPMERARRSGPTTLELKELEARRGSATSTRDDARGAN
ncbi:hypothetical protein THAOC_01695, partial [Thalassiosira oceanica]